MTAVLQDPRPSSLCSTTLFPDRLTSTFVEILQRHFSDPENIDEPALQNLIYRPESRETSQQAWNANAGGQPLPTLMIDSLLNWVPAKTNHRPAVLVGEDKYVSQRISIGDKRFPQVSVPWGEEPRQRLLVGSHRVVCLGKDRQTSLLAKECYRELSEFADVIRRYLQLQRFEVLEIGAPFRVKEAPDTIGISLTLGVVAVHAWTIRAEEPLFASVGMQAQRL